jgi:hypothetical protein
MDAGELARRGALGQAEIDAFQDALAEALLERVHAPLAAPEQPLSQHVKEVVEHSLRTLEGEAALARLIHADSIRLNHEPLAGPRAAFARVSRGRKDPSLRWTPSLRFGFTATFFSRTSCGGRTTSRQRATRPSWCSSIRCRWPA